MYIHKDNILLISPRFWNEYDDIVYDPTINITKHHMSEIDTTKFNHLEGRVKLKNQEDLDMLQCFMKTGDIKSAAHYFSEAPSMLLNIKKNVHHKINRIVKPRM